MAFLGLTEETDNLFPCVRLLGVFLGEVCMTYFVQSENKTAERILNFLKFSNTAFANPIQEEITIVYY